MKRLTSIFLLVCGFISLTMAKEVEPATAQTVAKNFYHWINPQISPADPQLIHTYITSRSDGFLPDQMSEIPLVYVFAMGDNHGFVLVSGDDVAWPVLGYALDGTYPTDRMPDNFRKWIQGYEQQIMLALENRTLATESTTEQWGKLINNQLASTPSDAKAVNPLLSTTWDQSPYYNALCPGGSVTGCVATAMAQVMKYWNHPAQGTGMHSYNHPTYGTLSANFGSTVYQWSSMPNSVNSSNNAVATLIYHCGVSVDMNYSPQSSGAWVVEDDDPICAESALKNYFGYSTSLHGEKRDNGYSTSQWINMIKGELDGARPVLYAGFGSGGGHAFVCDGYNSSDYFHFNWGWSGYYDGYFSIDALDPGGTGTGGGTGGYNSGHQALIGVVPYTATTSYNLALYDWVSISPNPIAYGEAFSVHTDIANFGTGSFNGDFSAVVFDQSLNAVEWVETLTGAQLGSNQHYTNGLTFSTSGLTTVLPGSYYIGIFYRPSGGEWVQVADGDFDNMIPFSVGNTSNIEMYSNFNIIGGTTLTQGQECSVFVDILNNGSSTYFGMFDISLYHLDGSFAYTIETLSGANLDPGYYYDDVEFSNYSLEAEPGTYLLALQHKPTGGNWELAGSTNYPNPIQVIVKTQGYQPDVYESNDIINNAFTLPVNFSGNTASVYTTGSNSHVGNDYDYYRLVLPSGYDYTIYARAHDSYNSGNGQVYTNDVLWSYKSTSMWSNAFDDMMSGYISVRNGGDLYFLVAPYFLGETGTYLLDIQISRTPTGLEEIGAEQGLRVYPNPANEELTIDMSETENCEEYQLLDMQGKILTRQMISENSGPIRHISTTSLSNGTYLLLIKADGRWMQKKVVIAH